MRIFPSLCTLALPALVAAQTVTLSWEPACGPEVTGYRLCYGPVSEQYVACADVGNQLSVTYNLAGQPPGTTYYVAVQAYGDDPHLDSEFSKEVVVTVPEESCEAPQMHVPVIE